MSIKVALNILYLCLHSLSQEKLSRLLEVVDIEDLLMKLIQTSLEVNFVPIRKVVVLFYLTLNNKFSDSNAVTIQSVEGLKDNIVMESMLQA